MRSRSHNLTSAIHPLHPCNPLHFPLGDSRTSLVVRESQGRYLGGHSIPCPRQPKTLPRIIGSVLDQIVQYNGDRGTLRSQSLNFVREGVGRGMQEVKETRS